MLRARTLVIALAAGLGLAGCTYNDGYGYGGVEVGYGTGRYYDDGYYDAGYYGGGYGGGYYGAAYPSFGWFGGFYYPGNGIYVYDRGGRRHRWNDNQRRYWEGRRYTLRDREDRRDFRQFRREGIEDRRGFRAERREDRQALRDGTITREQFRADRQGDRQAYRADRRQDRREFRQDLRDGRARPSFTPQQRQDFRAQRQQFRQQRQEFRQQRQFTRGAEPRVRTRPQ